MRPGMSTASAFALCGNLRLIVINPEAERRALERIAADLSAGTVLAVNLEPVHWVVLSAVPLVAAALTLITTRVTVHRALATRG